MKATRQSADRASDDRAIERAAAAWLARRVGGLSPEEEDEFARWREASSTHAKVFAGLEETWRSLDGLKELRLPDGRAFDADLPASTHWRRVVTWGSALSAVAAAIALVFILWPQGEGSREPMAPSAIITAGEFHKLDLPDGSIVRLNTDSAVTVDFTRSERSVHLVRGEAIFTVVKDATRPFVVRAHRVAVRAVGTEFNVRLRADAIEVLVTNGRVRVDDKAGAVLPGEAVNGSAWIPPERDAPLVNQEGRRHPLEVSAGEKIIVPVAVGSAAAVVTAVAAEEIQRELAWQERRLEFGSTPLTEVVAEFNRYNRHKLIIGDDRLKERRFGGFFRADNADAFVRLLETRFDVKAERSEQETVLRLNEATR